MMSFTPVFLLLVALAFSPPKLLPSTNAGPNIRLVATTNHTNYKHRKNDEKGKKELPRIGQSAGENILSVCNINKS